MKKLVQIGALLMVVGLMSAWADDNALPTWFDYEKCDFCRCWGAEPALVAHTREEFRPLSDGIVWITYIDKDYRPTFTKVMAAEAKVVEDLNAGEKLTVCQYCAAVNSFGKKGVRIEGVEGSDAIVTLYTSTDSSMVRELQAFGARAVEEEAKANGEFLKSKEK